MERTPQLGFGIMRLPQNNNEIDWTKTKEMIDEYMQGEFCYFDLHPAYMHGKAQDVLRELVVKNYQRDSYKVANKMPYYGIKKFRDYEVTFAKELEVCGLEYFDYYMLHAVTRDVYEMHEGIGGFRFLAEKKAEGKIGKIGISFHDKPELLEEILIKHLEIDFVQLQINFFDWESPVICSKECYEIAVKHKKQIMVMEPIKGGSLANSIELNGKLLTSSDLARYALQFVASLTGVDVILSGMSEVEHVRENRATILAENCSDGEIYHNLIEQLSKMEKINCTNCRYCVAECPRGIDIPDIISILNTYKGLSNNKIAFLGGSRRTYRGIVYKKGKASDCIKCSKCEKRCPQKLEIRSYMKEAEKLFEVGDLKGMNYYTAERNAQILIYLLNVHNIKKIVISPGSTNDAFVYSVQQDGFFELYSAADERSAAYIACGLAEESGEPVVLSCTGATASRNYIPALTEAYYRKIPILAVTSALPASRIGHNIPQMIDRTNPLNDIVKLSVQIPVIKDKEDEWNCEVAINKAILELNHRGKGPVHINLATSYSRDFSVRKLPPTRVIRRITEKNLFPEMSTGKIGIFCGAHSKWSKKLIEVVDAFCEKYNAVVIYDHTSNYSGKYGVLASLISRQKNEIPYLKDIELLIHIGNISGAYLKLGMNQVWRVNPDGAICDTFRKLNYVFEMEEEVFFEEYLNREVTIVSDNRYKKEGQEQYMNLVENMPELPFSNAWIAQQTAHLLPQNSVLHLGILNSLRCWNFFEVPKTVRVYSNTGGFGIDGCVSTLIGASLADINKIYFGVVGDLAFFYDMNVLGNRHVGSNVRILIINNGCGTEFKNYSHLAAKFGTATDDYIAAAGHYGNKSKLLVKNYAENLGFKYFSASTKEEYKKILPIFTSSMNTEKSLLVEVFTNSQDESDALKAIDILNGEKVNQDEINARKVEKPLRISGQGRRKEVVLWGTGNGFVKHLSTVEEVCSVKYVCDNNKSKWGKEIVPGIKCISPKELSELKDIFVVLMIEDAKIAFQIANQLLDMGIDTFDLVSNWLQYADNKDFV